MADTAPAVLYNQLGNGQDPNLSLKLLDNGPKWSTFNINYGASGNIPLPNPYNASEDWSVWEVYDDQGNNYGSFKLNRQDETQDYTLSDYASTTDYYLNDIHFNPSPSNPSNYSLSADSIHRPAPFPNVPPSTPACYNGTNIPIKLSVSGNEILADGRPVIFQGFDRPSTEWGPGQYLSEKDIQNIAATGANVIRIPLNVELWNQSGDVSDIGSYQQTIDAMIQVATQNNMAVILDLHWMDSASKQTPMPFRNAIPFWSEIASRYKDHGTVIFELFNEPFNVSPDVWLNGNDQYAGMQEMLKAIRGAGANNLALLNGLAYGYDQIHLKDQWDALAGEPNLIMGMHAYNDQGTASYDPNFGGSFQNNLGPYLNERPIFSTEFGCNQAPAFNDGSWQGIYKNILSFYDAYQIHGTGFAWWIGQPSFPSMITGDWSNPVLQNGGELYAEQLLGKATKFFDFPAPTLDMNELVKAQQYDEPIAAPHRNLWGRIAECFFGACIPRQRPVGDIDEEETLTPRFPPTPR